MSSNKEFLQGIYASFNVHDLEKVLAVLHPDVDWPNGMEGGRMRGRDSVRDYWKRQLTQIESRVEPLSIEDDDTGHTVVQVHQVVRDLAGNKLSDRIIHHVYRIQNGLIERMDIRDGE